MSQYVDDQDTVGWLGYDEAMRSIIKPNEGFFYKTKEACIKQVSRWNHHTASYELPERVSVFETYLPGVPHHHGEGLTD